MKNLSTEQLSKYIENAHKSLISFSLKRGLNPHHKNYGDHLLREIINAYIPKFFTGRELNWKRELIHHYFQFSSFLFPFRSTVHGDDKIQKELFSRLITELMPVDLLQEALSGTVFENKTLNTLETGSADEVFLALAIIWVIENNKDVNNVSDSILQDILNLIEGEIPRRGILYSSENLIPSAENPYPKTYIWFREYINLEYINTFYMGILQNIIYYYPLVMIRYEYPEWTRVKFLQKLRGDKPEKNPEIGKKVPLEGRIVNVQWIKYRSPMNKANRSGDHITFYILNETGMWDLVIGYTGKDGGTCKSFNYNYLLSHINTGCWISQEVHTGAPTYYNSLFDLCINSCFISENPLKLLSNIKP